jgi:putative intracellular protease/amidase
MYRGVIITGPGFQDHDVVYTYYRLKEEGYDVDIATKGGLPVKGKYGVPLPVYIVTAKDSASVVEILGSRGIAFPREHVFGEQTAKLSALQAIQRLEQVEQEQLYFFDDNISDGREEKEDGNEGEESGRV